MVSSALVMQIWLEHIRPLQTQGKAPWYTWHDYHISLSLYIQHLDRHSISIGKGSPRTSVQAYCCHNRSVQVRLGHCVQLWALRHDFDLVGISIARIVVVLAL